MIEQTKSKQAPTKITKFSVPELEILTSNINTLMRARLMSKQDLIDQSGISFASIYNIGKPNKFNPTVETLSALARTFKVSIGDLFDPQLHVYDETALPPDYKRRSVYLTDFQWMQVKEWLENNKEYVRRYQHERSERLRNMAKK